MGRRSLDEALLALRDGRITMNSFFQLVAGDIRRMADALFSRWVLPPAITEEDLFQQMCLSAIAERRELEWVPGTKNKKGVLIPISAYWNWHLHTAGKRWMHTQRGAKRRSGKAMSEFPICMAYFRDDDGFGNDNNCEDRYDNEFDRFADRMSVDAHQSNERAAQEVLLEAYDKLPIPMAVAWAVYVKEGDTEAAARRIDASPGLGSTCQASTIDEARIVVRKAVHKGRAIARAMTNHVTT